VAKDRSSVSGLYVPVCTKRIGEVRCIILLDVYTEEKIWNISVFLKTQCTTLNKKIFMKFAEDVCQ
jgi:hypothetical protein